MEQLETASFTSLHHGIKSLGIVCHDIDRHQPCYFSTLDSRSVRLSDVARASAAVPGMLPAKTMIIGTEVVRLADGGISDALPIDFVRSGLGATHVHHGEAEGPEGADDERGGDALLSGQRPPGHRQSLVPIQYATASMDPSPMTQATNPSGTGPMWPRGLPPRSSGFLRYET